MSAVFQCVIQFKKLSAEDIKLIVALVEFHLELKPVPKHALLIYSEDPITPTNIFSRKTYKNYILSIDETWPNTIIINYNLRIREFCKRWVDFHIIISNRVKALEFTLDEEYIFGKPNAPVPKAAFALKKLFNLWAGITAQIPTSGVCMGPEGGGLEDLKLVPECTLHIKNIDHAFDVKNIGDYIDEYWDK
jgi:hypothetical protein